MATELKNGEEKEYYENGKLKFVGNYLNGKRHGKGKEYYENGDRYSDDKLKYDRE